MSVLSICCPHALLYVTLLPDSAIACTCQFANNEVATMRMPAATSSPTGLSSNWLRHYIVQKNNWLTSSTWTTTTSCCTRTTTAPHLTTAFALWHHLLLHHVNYLVWYPQILDRAATDVAFWHAPEPITILHIHRRKQSTVLFQHCWLGVRKGLLITRVPAIPKGFTGGYLGKNWPNLW